MKQSGDIGRKNITQICWANGLTPEEVLQLCGYKKPSYASELTPVRIDKIKDFFGVSEEDLYAEDILERVYGKYEFPVNLGILLAVRGIQKQIFAADIDATPSVVGYYLRGSRKPSTRMVKIMQGYFGLPARVLLFGHLNISFTLEREIYDGQMEKQKGTNTTVKDQETGRRGGTSLQGHA